MSTVRRFECVDCGCPVDDQDEETRLWWCAKCDDQVLAVEVLVTPVSEARLVTRCHNPRPDEYYARIPREMFEARAHILVILDPIEASS